jgi:hypothetical protein
MPGDFAPWRTIYGFARRWAAVGVVNVIRDQLRRKIRLARHLIGDNGGLELRVMVTAADVSDPDAAKELLFRLALTHPEVSIVLADSSYVGKLVDWAKTYLDITIKTVR